MELLTLDVRSMLKAKQKPYDLIMQYVDRLADSNVFELHTPFKPSPLYKVLAKQQIRHVYYKKSLTHFISQFYRLESIPYTFHLDLRDTVTGDVIQQVRDVLQQGQFSDTVEQVAAWVANIPPELEQELDHQHIPFTVGTICTQRCLLFKI